MKRIISHIISFFLFPFPSLSHKLKYSLYSRPTVALQYSDIPASERKVAQKDMKKALMRHGLYYQEYILYGLYGKSDEYKSSFISEIGRYALYRRFNTARAEKKYESKYSVYLRYHDFYLRKAIIIRNPHDLMKIDELIMTNKATAMILKPDTGSCGEGVVKISSKEPTPKATDNKSSSLIDEISDIITKQTARPHLPYICEEYIKQSADMASFNSDSVNTVRLLCVTTDKPCVYDDDDSGVNGGVANYRDGYCDIRYYRVGNCAVISPFMRMGRMGKVTDNAGAGGIIVPIIMHKDEWRLSPVGRDESGKYYRAHPDSRLSFDGFPIPQTDELISTACEIMKRDTDIRMLSLDLAHTDEGWVLVEINAKGQFIGQQMCDLVGKKRLAESLL